MGSLPDSKYIIQTDGYWFVEAHDVDPSKGYITVSAKGVINGLSNEPNDGADFGPDTYNPNHTGSGIPYTQTSGIQEAINYLDNLGGGEIKLLSGSHIISSRTSITIPNISIIAEKNAIISPTSSFTGDIFLIDIDNATEFVYNLAFNGITFDFTNVSSGTNANGIHIKYTNATKTLEYYGITILNCYAKNLAQGSVFYNNSVIYITATNNTPTLGQGVVVNNCIFENCNIAVQTAGTSGLALSNIVINNSPNGGIWIGQAQSADAGVSFGPDTLCTFNNLILYNPENTLAYTTTGTNRGLLITASGWSISNVVVQGYGIGVYCNNVESSISTLSNVIALYNSGIGIHISGSNDDFPFPINLISCNAIGNGNGTGGGTGATGSGLYVTGKSVAIIGGGYFANNGYGIYKDITSANISTLIRDADLGRYSTMVNNSGALYVATLNSSEYMSIENSVGYTPTTATPSVPASGTAQQNTNPFSVNVYLYGGTVTVIDYTPNGGSATQVGTAGPATVRLNPGDSITLTYSGTPTWNWVAV